MKFIGNIRSTFAQSFEESSDDKGTVIETVMLTAGFVVLALVVVGWLSDSLTNKAKDIASCVEGSKTSINNDADGNCEDQDAAETSSFKNDDSFKKRFG